MLEEPGHSLYRGKGKKATLAAESIPCLVAKPASEATIPHSCGYGESSRTGADAGLETYSEIFLSGSAAREPP